MPLFLYLPLLLEDLHLFAQAAQLFFLLGGEPFPLSGVDLGLVYPLTQRLGGDVQIAGDLRYWIPLSEERTSLRASSLNSGE
jgi:hypothetical protein